MTPSATHKHLFYAEMAKLLEAGFDIRKAAAVLMDSKLPAPQAALLKDLNHGLDSGQTIAAAYGKDTQAVTDLERDMMRELGRSADYAEGVAAFLGKRERQFKGQ